MLLRMEFGLVFVSPVSPASQTITTLFISLSFVEILQASFLCSFLSKTVCWPLLIEVLVVKNNILLRNMFY